jgi:dUTP pyrophosphatase
MKYTKIKKIEKTNSKPIYHLTVEKNHNFFGNNLCLHNCGYRGEIQATFKKTNGLDSLKYKVGERGAQIIIIPYPQIQFIETDELSDTDRGQGGFGSTGN